MTNNSQPKLQLVEDGNMSLGWVLDPPSSLDPIILGDKWCVEGKFYFDPRTDESYIVLSDTFTKIKLHCEDGIAVRFNAGGRHFEYYALCGRKVDQTELAVYRQNKTLWILKNARKL